MTSLVMFLCAEYSKLLCRSNCVRKSPNLDCASTSIEYAT